MKNPGGGNPVLVTIVVHRKAAARELTPFAVELQPLAQPWPTYPDRYFFPAAVFDTLVLLFR
jgi:hypothetical protein